MTILKSIVLFLCLIVITTFHQTYASLPDSVALAIRNDDPNKETDSLIRLARFYSRTASLEWSTELAKEGLARAQALTNDSLMLKAYYLLGSCYEDLGFYHMAIKTYESSLPILKRSGTTEDKGSIYNSMGIALDFLGDYQKSLQYYLSADSAFLLAVDEVGHANVLNNIGLIHFNQKNYYDAKQHFQSSLEVAKSLENEGLLAMAFSNLGMVAMEEKEYKQALSYYTACLQIDLKAVPVNPNWVGSDYSSLGEIWTAYGNYDSAFYYYTKGVEFKREARAKRPLVTAYHQISEMLVGAKKPQTALVYLDSAMVLAQQIEDPLIHLEQYRIRAKILAELGQSKEALVLLENYIHLNDSLRKVQNYKDGKLLEEEFNLQLRQREVEEIAAKLEIEESLSRNYSIGLLLVVLLSIGLLYLFYLNLRKNKILEAQQSDLQEALSVKTRFLSVVSHEIRTPLHVIRGMANSLNSSTLNLESQEAVKALQASSEQLTHLVNEILDLNKLEHGSMKISQQPFDLNEVIHTLKGAYSQHCEAKGISFMLHVSDELPTQVIGDRLKLEQVLNNLLNNAVKFTDDGKVSLTLNVLNSVDGLCAIKFTVADTGIGIPKEHHHDIFKPFFQSDSDLNRSYSGTGLGLAISSSLLEMMGATIAIESTLNQGTEFSFIIQFKLSSQENDLSHQEEEDHWQWPKSRKILVAEDYAQNRMLLKMMLNQLGAEATWTENGLECLQAAKEEKFQCILLDMHMPIMDGYEAAQNLRMQYGDSICIIGLTAADQEEIKGKGTENFDHILYKPYSQQDLRNILKKSILRHLEQQ